MAAKKAKQPSPALRTIAYALQNLFVDQDRDWVAETIAPVLAWVPAKGTQPFRFVVTHTTNGRTSTLNINGTPATKSKPARLGKAAQLIARVDIAEVHLSLWCASPRLGIMEQLKP